MKSVFTKLKLAATGLALIAASLAATSNVAMAGDFTSRADIVSVRSYLNGAYFVTLTAAGSTLKVGGVCTTVYKVPASSAGAKTIIATLLTAKAAGSKVELEVATGCPTGWGEEIISVVLF